MKHLQQDRKTDLANYFIRLLQKMNLPLTASKVSEQALPTCKRNVQKDIHEIMSINGITEEAKNNNLACYFKRYISKHVKNGLIQDAVNVLQNYVPLYFQSLEEFSTLFAGDNQIGDVEVGQLLQDFFGQCKDIPQKRVAFHKFTSQIWFVKSLGDKVVVVDENSNGKIIRGSVILAQRDKMHEGRIYCLTTRNNLCFATGGEDKVCRVWNGRFQKIYETTVHQARINSIVFLPVGMITFDNNGLTVAHKSILKPDIVRKLKMKTVADAKYMVTRKLLITLSHEGKKSELNYIDIEQTVTKKRVLTTGKSFNIELSRCQKMVFVNTAEMQIHVYSTRSYHLKYRFSGYLQKNFLMRMSIGGSKGHLLAVTSQDGQVCIFNLDHLELISKLKVSNTAVNCVTWINEELYMGLDSGYVQIWSPNPKGYEEQQQKYINMNCQKQKMCQQRQNLNVLGTNGNRIRMQSEQTQ